MGKSTGLDNPNIVKIGSVFLEGFFEFIDLFWEDVGFGEDIEVWAEVGLVLELLDVCCQSIFTGDFSRVGEVIYFLKLLQVLEKLKFITLVVNVAQPT